MTRSRAHAPCPRRFPALAGALCALALAGGCGDARLPAGGGAPAADDQPAATVALPHLGQGAHVLASSTHLGAPGEGPPGNLVDGDPASSWSSAYADNQELLIDLGTVQAIARLRMLWTRDAAKSFSVQISPDGGVWSAPIATSNGRVGPRIEDVPIGAPARYLRIALHERTTAQGFALYEIMIIAR